MRSIQNQKIGLCLFLLALVAVVGFGCGGGGGGGGDEPAYVAPAEVAGAVEEPVEPPPPPPPPPDLIVGVGFKGPIEGGTVNVYASDADASQGALIDTTFTDADGHYDPPIDLGSYSGDVLIEITGGTYVDEATGVEVPNAFPLHAAVTGVSGTIAVMVTPFTEIAYRLATQTDLNVDEANYLVGTMAGVSNIVRTEPALVTKVGICDTALPSQLEYGLLMAMISQWVADADPPMTLDDAIQAIVDDLADNQLDTIGGELTDALVAFMGGDQNKSCISEVAQTLIDDAIFEITNAPVEIPPDASSYVKTKQLIGDFRDTVQTVYNYRPDVGPRGIMETPFKDFANELQTGIVPELTDTVGRAAWIIQSAMMLNQTEPPTLEFVSEDLTLTFYPMEDGFEFDVVQDGLPPVTLDDGSLEIFYDEIVGVQYPASGTFSAEMTTATDVMTVNFDFVGELSGGLIPTEFVLTLSGSMTAPGLTVTLHDTSQVIIPVDSLDPMIPDQIFISSSIQTDTVLMQGDLDISSFGYNANIDPGTGAPVGLVPAAFTFQGSFQPEPPTGALFSGTVTGGCTNPTTFDLVTEFRHWYASFNGQIAEPGRPTITMLLSVGQNAEHGPDILILGAGYWRTNLDGTVVWLSGSGLYDIENQVLTLSLTNQDGLIVEILFLCAEEQVDDRFSGTIETSGGLQTAILYTIGGVPWVDYVVPGGPDPEVIDNEPIF
jgi:hypothetical protein